MATGVGWVGVAVAGALGAWARYLVGLALAGRAGAFPRGTFLINVSGCLLMGLVASLAVRAPGVAPVLRTYVATGFVGAYTTFSTFSVETLLLWETRPRLALGYAAGSILAGLGGIAVGTALGAWL